MVAMPHRRRHFFEKAFVTQALSKPFSAHLSYFSLKNEQNAIFHESKSKNEALRNVWQSHRVEQSLFTSQMKSFDA